MRGGSRVAPLAALGIVLLAGCGRSGRPNVFLVVIDTARADRFSFDGYARRTSPQIADLASEGAIYEQAYTPAPWTLPAHASLFTGLFPSSHGADSGHLKLDEEFRTLAEVFHDAGYRTLAYVANPWVGRQYGLGQGFDTYEEIWKEVREPHEDAGAGELNARVERFLEWRSGNPVARAQPFFVFLNYIEPHLPYNPPEPARSLFLPPGTDRSAVERLRHFKHPDELRYVLGLGGLEPKDLSILSSDDRALGPCPRGLPPRKREAALGIGRPAPVVRPCRRPRRDRRPGRETPRSSRGARGGSGILAQEAVGATAAPPAMTATMHGFMRWS